MRAIIADGGRVFATPWTPPAAYKTNGLGSCTLNAGLITADYGAYATWLANFVQSLQTEYGITLYAISVQNEPDICAAAYDSAYWTAANIDTFVKNNLGPTFVSDKLSTLIFVPEGSGYNQMVLGGTCGGDPSCNAYVDGISWHDYDASLGGTNTIAADPYPSSWPAGKKYWETEASCGPGFGPNFCQKGFHTDMTNALNWAAVIDQRIAVDGANAWLYWWLINLYGAADDEGLIAGNGTIAKRAYVMGQYSKFVRPGYSRIGTTPHLPETEVSVSAYQNLPTNTLVIIATNYSGSADTQTFTITNAPVVFSAMNPWITSASLSLAQQTGASVSSNSFTYTLPPQSITTFVGTP
jgi:glucuronoarabinoxylan endo-1,4-beta-xylanase